jgi:HAD superfamily hydrolase (TIGR01484 family)
MDSEMAALIKRLLEKKLVAVIGGGKYELFKRQLLAQLNAPKDLLKNLFLFPNTATSFYRYRTGSWKQVYSEKLSADEKKKIFEAFEVVFRELDYSHPKKVYGKLIEDRGSQVTFSALGQQAPLHLKEKWKREHTADKLKIAEVLQKHLPNLEVRAAGYTSIDVTRKGIDKEYGIRQIEKHLGVQFNEMLFIGDALFLGGNDYAVFRTGVSCLEVSEPRETKKIIKSILKSTI